MKDFFILALKNLRHRGIRSWLTLLGILIGVMAVVSLISLGAGLQAAVGAQFGVSNTEIITVTAGGISAAGPPGTGVSNKLTLDDVDAIEKIANVDNAIQRILTNGRMEYENAVEFEAILSIPEGEDGKLFYEILDIEPLHGRLLNDGDVNKVFVGYNFYKKGGIFEDKSVLVGKNINIAGKSFEVVGVADKKGSFVFDNIVYMSDEVARDLFDYGDDVDLIAVRVKDKDLMDKTKEDIEKLMRKQRDVEIGKEDFEVSTPEAMLETVNSILGGVQAFIVIIALISILVGAVGIVNTMTTSVLERRAEIGIMKAIGAKNSQIFLQFLIESGLLGLVGGFIGCTLGVIVGVIGVMGINSWLGDGVGISIDFVLIGGALVGSFLIGAVAGIVPAMNAAKQNPVEALRG